MNMATSNDCVLCSVVCHMRSKAFKELKMRAKSAQNAFVIRGFETWKLATTVFRQRELSAFRNEAVGRVIRLLPETTDIGVAMLFKFVL